jgi:YfiH family protein
MKEKLIEENNFPSRHFTTIKLCADMKDEAARNVLLHSLGLDVDNLVLAKQPHGNNVAIVTKKHKGSFINDCDGLITADKDIMLGVFTADCMPVLMVSKDKSKSAKAVVHAGWKGLASGILINTVKIFKEGFGVNPETLAVYIAPHIKECCYEVSADFGDIFETKLKNCRLNLAAVACKILEKEGVNGIYVSPHCTCCESDLFFSYRRDKTADRMITIVL